MYTPNIRNEEDADKPERYEGESVRVTAVPAQYVQLPIATY
jgi:hypothetical protein